MHLSSDSYVDVDACRMWYYEMWFYDGTCDGGRILVMECNVTITSHKKKRLRNWGLAGKIQWHTKIHVPLRVNTNRINF